MLPHPRCSVIIVAFCWKFHYHFHIIIDLTVQHSLFFLGKGCMFIFSSEVYVPLFEVERWLHRSILRSLPLSVGRLGKENPVGCVYAAAMKMYWYPQTFVPLSPPDLYFYFTTTHKTKKKKKRNPQFTMQSARQRSGDWISLTPTLAHYGKSAITEKKM